ncbi:MAG: hypothetical protein C0626_05055 [Arcobacter sp.]|uniref:hypothetical protein n=1 Tax=uncultured Arcobacter sp. TaxID=165434 RepID=UPI000CB2D325|nr:hypothetical protein [uncultured Arcobacter sp.]PLY10354.1 MAG: hypothetical protein C0626_05055 [Arcobacter sp.]
MFEINTINNKGINRGKTLKSSMHFNDFEKRLLNIDMDISKFSSYFGIARSTIYGWKRENKLIIPLYIEKIIDLLEVKNQLRDGIEKLHKTNSYEVKKLYEINTQEPIKKRKVKK